jgi:hypothetical protein
MQEPSGPIPGQVPAKGDMTPPGGPAERPGRQATAGHDPDDALVTELERLERDSARRHEELRREKGRLELDAVTRQAEVLAELKELQASVTALAKELQSSVSRMEEATADGFAQLQSTFDAAHAQLGLDLARLERVTRDTLLHHVVRFGNGIWAISRSLADGDQAGNLRLAVRLAIDPRARRVWSEQFDGRAYLDANADVVRANQPSALHYILIGYREGREPSSGFSGRAYLEANPDIAGAGVNPLLHYAVHGAREGRRLRPVPPVSPEVPTPDEARVAPEPVTVMSMPRDLPHARTRSNTRWPASHPLATVVIPSFNYGGSLRAAVGSVLGQTWDDLEVIVVESASTDPHAAAAVRKLEAERLPRTTVYYRDRRMLVGDNRNYGIERAHGRYVVCLDADDELEPTYLEVALFLAEAYQFDLVYPSVRLVGEREEVWSVRDTDFEESLERNTIPTVALFRRSAWLEAGGYRDWGLGEGLIYEDWAFWTRLLGMGYRPKAIPAPLLRHRAHQGSLSQTATSTLTRHRAGIRAANDDLMGRVSVPDPTDGSTPVTNAYVNLLAREPTPSHGGSILIASWDALEADSWDALPSLARSLSADGVRVLVASREHTDEAEQRASMLRHVTDHVYDLPRLFEEGSRQEAFLLYLLQRYHVHTLAMVGGPMPSELHGAIRRLSPAPARVALLSGMERDPERSRAATLQADAAIVATEAHRVQLLEAADVPIRVIPGSGSTEGPQSLDDVAGGHPSDEDPSSWDGSYRSYRDVFGVARALADVRSRAAS